MKISHKEETLLRQLIRENLNEFSLSGLFGGKKKKEEKPQEEPKKEEQKSKKETRKELSKKLQIVKNELDDVKNMLTPDKAGLFALGLGKESGDDIKNKGIKAISDIEKLEKLATTGKVRTLRGEEF